MGRPSTQKSSLDQVEIPIYDVFIISNTNQYLQTWNAIIKILCLISSHVYLYMASFLNEDPDPSSTLFKMDITFEIAFLISMVLEFLTDIQPEQKELKPIRDPILIAKNYINGNFLVDFLALIPFSYFVKIQGGYGRFFYLFKILRL